MILLSLISLAAALLINVESASKPLSAMDYYYMTMVGNGGNGIMNNILNFVPKIPFLNGGTGNPGNSLFKQRGRKHLLCEAVTEPCYSYDRSSPIGPYCWGRINGHNTECCDASGSFQSPISIPRPRRTIYTPQRLQYLSSTITGKVENIGVYPEFFSNADQPVMLKGVPGSNAEYILDNVHVHSGVRGAYRQTENLLYGRSFSAEAHVVHHRSDFSSVAEASKHPGGIAVVSIYLTTEKRRYNPTSSRALDTMLNQLHNIRNFTEEAHVCRAENRRIKQKGIYSKLGEQRICRENDPNFDPDSDSDADSSTSRCRLHKKALGCGNTVENVTFNPNDLLSSIPTYLTFEGGLTTPPCSESVIWIVAENPAYISDRNMENLNKLQSRIINQTISDFGNLRPLHDPAERDVFKIIYGRYPPRRRWYDDDDDDDDDDSGDDDNHKDDDYDDVYYDEDDYNNDFSEYDYNDDDNYNGSMEDEEKDGGGEGIGNGNGDDRRRERNGDNIGEMGNGDDPRRNGDNIGENSNGDDRRRNGDNQGEMSNRDYRSRRRNGDDQGEMSNRDYRSRRRNGDDQGEMANGDDPRRSRNGDEKRGNREREREDARRRRRRFYVRRRRKGRRDDKGDDKGDDN